MDVFVGQICAFGFNYAPIDFQMCQGQTLPINQYSTLFAVLGVAYGGNGTSNFMLPNLQGLTAIGFGQGPGLPIYNIGQTGGNLAATMTASNMANHTHVFSLTVPIDDSTNNGTSTTPQNNILSGGNGNIPCYSSTLTGTNSLQIAPNNMLTTDAAGVAAPTAFSLQRPNLALNYCIALYGIYPVRQ